jgi:peptidoglycan-associated lipoprotein
MIKYFYLLPLAFFVISCSSKSSDTIGKNAKKNSASTYDQVLADIEDKYSYFDYDKATLKPSAQDLIKTHAKYVKDYKLNILIEGHCDERGTKSYNYKLGLKRANAIKNAFISYGVQPSAVKIVSYGEDRPQTMGHDETSWSKNRVGVIVYDDKSIEKLKSSTQMDKKGEKSESKPSKLSLNSYGTDISIVVLA